MTEGDRFGGEDPRWNEVRRRFDEAVELPEADREAYLASIEDDDVRAEVASLIGAAGEDEGFLETPAADLLADTTSPAKHENLAGQRIGAYQLLRLVGSGGMGVVYESERADEQYRQRVAIKLMRAGVKSEMVAERFRRERQILASLDHPGVARLIDGGVTDAGQLYYVMEYIDGIPITEYCSSRSLGLRDRLELFRQVCDAVHYAHRNLVVHRDIKPGNILVTEDGRAKLLDFGIAKLLSNDASGEQTLTLMGGRMLTPAYSSPEQVQGELVTTASDVYSLGVVLYELLTGKRPFDSDAPSLREAIDEMAAAEPTRPSAAVTQETVPQFGDSGWRQVRRTLEGELDNIVLMALQKEPDRRYQSVAQLSDDIRRYLGGLPVLAQRDTATYRLKKFVARHRSAALAAAAFVVLLAGGLIATAIQAQRAERAREVAEARFDDTRELANALLFDLHDAVADLPGSTTAREMLVTRGLEYLDELAAEAGDDPALQQELAGAYFQLGLVLGTPTGASLGQVSQAETSFQRSLAIADVLVQANPEDDVARRSLALAHEKLGDVMAFRGAVDDGVYHARQALALWTYFAQARPDNEGSRLSAVISHVKLGDLLGNPTFNNAGDVQGAIGEYQYASNLLQAPLLADSESIGVIRYRGLVSERMASMFRVQERYEDALTALEQSLAVRLELVDNGATDFVRDVGVTYHQMCGVYLSLDEPGLAGQSCTSMMPYLQQLFDQDPANAQAARDLALGHEMLYRVSLARGRDAEAAAALRDGIQVREDLMDRAPDDLVNQRDRARALIWLCQLETRTDPGALENCRNGREALLPLRDAGVTTDEDDDLIEAATAVS